MKNMSSPSFRLGRLVLGLSISILVLAATHLQAARWRVNNQLTAQTAGAGSVATFTTLAAAQTAATNGDTIYVEGSPIAYSGLTCTKVLTWIGPGYFLTINDSTQAMPNDAWINTAMTFNAGSAGSTFMGFRVDINQTTPLISVNVNNVVIARNYLRNNSTTATGTAHGVNIATAVTGTTIIQNFFQLDGNVAATVRRAINMAGTSPNTLIASNIFVVGFISDLTTTLPTTTASITQCSQAIFMVSTSSATIQNNFINGHCVIANADFNHNVMPRGIVTSAGGVNTTTYNTHQSPAATGGMIITTAAGDNNIHSQSFATTTLFTSPVGTTVYTDRFYTYTNPLPAALNGNSTRRGHFGGPMPYRLAGLPPVPAVWSAIVPVSGLTNQNLNVTVRVRSIN
jgi:hypothetical protein